MFLTQNQYSILLSTVLLVLSYAFPELRSVLEHEKLLPKQTISPTVTPTDKVLSTTDTTIDDYGIVTKVIDGDTIQTSDSKGKHTIRLIGINSPESVDPRRPVECFGKEASAKAQEILLHQSIRLERDPTQANKDKYNRFLRYVFLNDGTNFNMEMIKEGYAYEYTYDLPYKYQKEFKDAQEDAIQMSKGLWSITSCSGQK